MNLELRNMFSTLIKLFENLQLIYALDASGISDLLLFIASNQNQQQYHLQMLEVRNRWYN